MEASQPVAKIFAASSELAPRELIAVFHRWIQRERLPGVLLFDVCDYSHVPDGPVVLLVAHEGFLSLDREHEDGAETRLGLQWRVRRGDPRPAGESLRGALRLLLAAALALEEDAGGKIRFAPGAIACGFDDRLHAPNDDATFAALRPELEALGAALYGRAEVARFGDKKSPLRALVSGPTDSLAALAARL